MEVQRRGSVQHRGSHLAGRLSGGCDAWHAFDSLFPAVTASGIPKSAAYKVVVGGSMVAPSVGRADRRRKHCRSHAPAVTAAADRRTITAGPSGAR